MAEITWLDDTRTGSLAELGGKGVNLVALLRAGLPVPPGFVLGTAAYTDFVAANTLREQILHLATLPPDASTDDYNAASSAIRDLFTAAAIPAGTVRQVTDAYTRLSADSPAVAVRSSATSEDLPTASFAGQQDTFLNIRGVEAVLAAVVACWASLWTARALSYRAAQGIDPATVSLAVVVQQMVPADAAGVMFTANPATGRRDQSVISAAWGLGESVVGGSVSTDDLTVETSRGTVLARHTADKEVMTVFTSAGTREQPTPSSLRTQPVVNDADAALLARLGATAAGHFGIPLDIEWARARGSYFLVQARPITALPDPVGDTPDQWPVPYPDGLYFRASIVEQLPDPLSPLFADLIDGSVSRSIGALMGRILGPAVVTAADIRLPTINGYAYYYYRKSAFLRVLARTLPAVVMLVRGEAQLGVEGWRRYSHPRYQRTVAEFVARPAGEYTDGELFDAVSTLLDAGTEYYTAVQSVIPTAVTSEVLFQGYYNLLVRRRGDPSAQSFLLGFDSEPIRAEKSLYDLAAATRSHPRLLQALLAATPAQLEQALASGEPPAGVGPATRDAFDTWRTAFQLHLERFGHAVYNLDFLTPVPADAPGPLLESVRFTLRGQGVDPHARQAASANRREAQTATVRARLGRLRRPAFDRLLGWAQTTAPVREDALADIGLAWPTIRRLLSELGSRFVAAGVISDPSDIFWLRATEVRDRVGRLAADPLAPPGGSLAASVEERKMLWRGQRRALPPQMLPAAPWMDRVFGAWMPARADTMLASARPGDVLTGVGASGGTATAPARVLSGPEDFATMHPGDVLVARMTTPAWTALFSMASAVVTDVGGPLSHSSIVAREYGIPAVLGTGVATQRLASGQRITVDGDAGTVTPLPDVPA